MFCYEWYKSFIQFALQSDKEWKLKVNLDIWEKDKSYHKSYHM